ASIIEAFFFYGRHFPLFATRPRVERACGVGVMSHPTASSSEPFPQSPMRFGLGAFLVLATVVSVVVGLWFLSASRQKAFVAAVQARGGAVFYDFQHDSDGPFDPSLNPPALARWLGVDAVA